MQHIQTAEMMKKYPVQLDKYPIVLSDISKEALVLINYSSIGMKIVDIQLHSFEDDYVKLLYKETPILLIKSIKVT